MPMRPADTRCVRDSQKVFSDLNEHVGAGNILGIRYTAAGGQYPALSIVPDVCSGSLGDVCGPTASLHRSFIYTVSASE